MKTYLLSIGLFFLAINVHAQNGATVSPAALKGTAKQQFLDSTLKNAGASPSKIQQFNAAKTLANTKMKQAKQDSTLTIAQKEEKYQQITDEKNASYK